MADEELWRRLREDPELVAAAAAASGPELTVQAELRRRFAADLVPLALQLRDLRSKAAPRFSRADRMWFDSVRLEQATSEVVARHKAVRFDGPVLDFCCGLGGDAVALASRGEVTAVDRDPLAGRFVSWNAEAYEVADRVAFVADDVASLPVGADQLVHIDPDRRPAGRRVRRVEEYEPGLPFLTGLTASARGGAIKVSPASNFGGKFAGCEAELISVLGECREATLWFGDLAGERSWRATRLPEGESLAGEPLDHRAAVTGPRRYLFDPDPAVVRSGLVDLLCERFHLSRLDEAEEYLTGDDIPDTAFVTPFRVIEHTGNNPKKIRGLLRAHDVGPLEVKARHVPVDANALQRKLQSPDGRPGVLVIARAEGRTRAILCERP